MECLKKDYLKRFLETTMIVLEKTTQKGLKKKKAIKGESLETGIPYQTLINLYLADCVKSKRKLEIAWK